MPARRISAEAMRLLEGYAWPGNVRELENVIERALALSTAPVLTVADLPAYLVAGGDRAEPRFELPEAGLDLEAYLERIRAELMRAALERCAGVQTQAAELLRMTFRSFRYYAKKAGLTGGGE